MSEAYNKTVNGLNSLYEDYVIATKELASTKMMLDEAKEVISTASRNWCIKPECECWLCEFLAKHEKKEGV